jgi:murein DD-endopeptidase MepM/ murein hydrolase activator NlpD
VSADVAAIIERARLSAQKPSSAGEAPAAEREQLKRIAAEFESMLLVQVLKDMRRAGSWDEENRGDTLGAESLFETLDVELATHLAKVRGMGLGRQLEEAFDRLHPAAARVAPATDRTLAPTSDRRIAPTSDRALAPTADRKPASTTDRTPPDVVSVVKAAVEKTAAAPAAVAHILKPVAGAVTSAFGWRRHPITHEVKFHQGVDLRAAYGQEVQAAAGGKVVFSGDQGGYGATVVVEHADGTRTRYAHLSARLVKHGDTVEAGEPLGRAGRSGSATGTHLHFEVIAPNGKRVEPERWAGGRYVPSSQAGPHDTRSVRLQTDQSGPAKAGLHGTAGNPPVMTVARSIQDPAAGAD